MVKGKGIWILVLGALGIGAVAMGMYDDEGVVDSGTLIGEGDVERYHWRVRKIESDEEGFAGLFVGEISPDKKEWERVAEGSIKAGVKGKTIETIALMNGFSG